MKRKIEFKNINDEPVVIYEDDGAKVLRSKNYNFAFNKDNGFFVRSGDTQESDANIDLGLPEIADIEISTICNGLGKPCKFCYKSNTSKGEYMTLDTFIQLFRKLPPTVTQIAFGIGDIDANPDMLDIFWYAKRHGVTPNVTINGWKMYKEMYDSLAGVCGAVAVSHYDPDVCFNAVKELTDRGMKQVNIHFMLSAETFETAMELLDKVKTEPRLEKLNAIVFLSLKKKGNAKNGFNKLSSDKFKELSFKALDNNISIGFDSCSAFSFLKAVQGTRYYNQVEEFIEPCESSVYSSYFNVKGEYFPCSFTEGTEGWEKGLDALNCDNFLEDVWWNDKTSDFRKGVIECRNNCKNCSIYEV